MGRRRKNKRGYSAAIAVLATAAIVLAATAIVLVVLLMRSAPDEPDDAHAGGDPGAGGAPELSAWLADWDQDEGLTDAEPLLDALTSVQLFAAYFGPDDELYFTDAFPAMLTRMNEAAQRQESSEQAERGQSETTGRSAQAERGRSETTGQPAGQDREQAEPAGRSEQQERGQSKSAERSEQQERGQPSTRLDLTVVNDRYAADGTAVQKDPELLSRLVASAESRSRHTDAIAEAALSRGFGGVEIDYERVKDEDWPSMCLFYAELYERLQAVGLELRVVLEPRAPVERLDLPEGPVYVMMAYNLYGTHSGPGPKADHAFVAELAERLAHVPGQPYMALATGGFVWQAGGQAAALTEREAASLAAEAETTPQRDEASGALHFAYTDAEDGQPRTVWYADGRTLTGWAETASRAGVPRIALWRLGGLEPDTLAQLRGLAGP
ncbi:glycosyl hydrolase [Paenibacillus sp. IB182496]|uniref:Glycosyl hydrolase n=1 Tax=Paenibacillus sabuli TaxID=2772509 RepID=A0A927BQF6_9BACL|nr:glycosyl hydrolase [Paenibacillus sabuli]MBD2844372.1 glycosyl hydrolase [Paenibacillus sabuli]